MLNFKIIEIHFKLLKMFLNRVSMKSILMKPRNRLSGFFDEKRIFLFLLGLSTVSYVSINLWSSRAFVWQWWLFLLEFWIHLKVFNIPKNLQSTWICFFERRYVEAYHSMKPPSLFALTFFLPKFFSRQTKIWLTWCKNRFHYCGRILRDGSKLWAISRRRLFSGHLLPCLSKILD